MITSLANARIKHLKELQQKARTRNKEKLFVIEGFKLFDEAPAELIKEIYVEESAYDKIKGCSKDTPLSFLGRVYEKVIECEKSGIPVETVTGEVFRKASDTETPQGILCVVGMPSYNLSKLLQGGNLLVLEDIQDPGNLGTMIRTGEGAGIAGIVLSKGCVDIFNPKTIRSTMGSLFRVPFVYVEDIIQAVREIKKSGKTVYAAHLKGKESYDEICYENDSVFLIGNEGNGLSDSLSNEADKYLIIPMGGKLESLNASIAAAILMYQARKR